MQNKRKICVATGTRIAQKVIDQQEGEEGELHSKRSWPGLSHSERNYPGVPKTKNQQLETNTPMNPYVTGDITITSYFCGATNK